VHTKFSFKTLPGRDQSGELNVHVEMILRGIFKIQDIKVQNGLRCTRIGRNGAIL
jgi:hypothetical protein